MNTRQRLGLSLAPLLLRIMLAVVFIWAGAVKLMTVMPVKGEDAAILANMGIGLKSGPIAPATPPATKPANPAAPAGMQPPDKPLPAPGAEPKRPGNPSRAEPPLRPEVQPIIVTQSEISRSSLPLPLMALAAAAATAGAPQSYTASDFPDAQEVLRVYGIAIGLHKASIPAGPTGSTMALVPAAFGQGALPIYLAWAAGITELAGGALVLIGLFTRFWAFGLACVMFTAMWLTQIGPAIQSGKTFLFILPNYAWDDMGSFTTLLFQFVLFMSALALTILGAGVFSVDGAQGASVAGGSSAAPKKPA